MEQLDEEKDFNPCGLEEASVCNFGVFVPDTVARDMLQIPILICPSLVAPDLHPQSEPQGNHGKTIGTHGFILDRRQERKYIPVREPASELADILRDGWILRKYTKMCDEFLSKPGRVVCDCVCLKHFDSVPDPPGSLVAQRRLCWNVLNCC